MLDWLYERLRQSGEEGIPTMRTSRLQGPRQGMTLIELLIVVAILGIISMFIIPNLLDSLQKAKQKRSMTDINGVGLAWMNWLTDQASAAAAGSQHTYDFSASLPAVTPAVRKTCKTQQVVLTVLELTRPAANCLHCWCSHRA